MQAAKYHDLVVLLFALDEAESLTGSLANPMCEFIERAASRAVGVDCPSLMVEQEGHGVREDLARQPACQMPEVARPHLLYAIALC